MAIFSCSHSTVGRTTHVAGTAGAHAGYVTRESAARSVVGEHMPLDRAGSRTWLDGQEAADRKNARVIDKVMLALPIELDAAERVQLVRDFAAAIGGGRIPWLAGIHDQGRDAGNPHAHVIFRDRDRETGKRVAGFSEKGSTDHIRETWEQVANQALERAGYAARIDRRSLEAQGVDRQAGIHVGPNVLAMEQRGIRPASRPEMTPQGRVINWPSIDQGRTRLDRQAEIEAGNDDRENDRGGKGKTEGSPMPVGAAPSPVDAAPVPASADIPGKTSEATQRPSQGADEASPRIDAPTPPDVSRFRQAIDRARARLDVLSTKLDEAFNRIRGQFLDQDRPREKLAPASPLKKQPRASRQLRLSLDVFRRDWSPDRTGPEL